MNDEMWKNTSSPTKHQNAKILLSFMILIVSSIPLIELARSAFPGPSIRQKLAVVIQSRPKPIDTEVAIKYDAFR